MLATIQLAHSQEDIAGCFPVLQELRPKLQDKAAFTSQILRQQKQGYILAFLQEDTEIAACIGYRILETLPWGKILYIDDLITRAQSRKQGLAS